MTRSGPQSGILNRPPQHLLLVALRLPNPRNRQTAAAALEALRDVVQDELHSNVDSILDTTDKTVPFPETGELGFSDGFDRGHLTVTVGWGLGAMEALEVPPDERPADLVAVPWEAIGGVPTNSDPGDVLLQICSDSPYIAEHVLRRLEHTLAGQLSVVWAVRGDQRFTSRAGRVNASEARALIGFHDGTSNLDPAHDDSHAALVFVDPASVPNYPPNPAPGPQPTSYGGSGAPPSFPPLREKPGREPDWVKGGTYCFAHISVQDIGRWDASPLDTQEKAIGRFKRSGASLDLADEAGNRSTEPAFAANPSDERVPLDSHVRKTNPRGPDDAARRIFRRGYPLMITDGTSGMQRGLVFLSFSRSTSTQIEFILRAWMHNPDFPRPGAGVDRLLAFDMKVLGGGYYFIPPLEDRRRPWTWILPPA